MRDIGEEVSFAVSGLNLYTQLLAQMEPAVSEALFERFVDIWDFIYEIEFAVNDELV